MATTLGLAVQGELFTYHTQRHLVAFRTGEHSASLDCVLLGGLTDGLLPTPWAISLADRLQNHSTGLVMPQLTSSGTFGWALGSLERDAQEVQTLLQQLPQDRQYILIGHSTGCQDVCAALKDTDVQTRTAAAILQAPVSDRPSYTDRSLQDEALDLVQSNKGDELMPRAAELQTDDAHIPRVPITAYRCVLSSQSIKEREKKRERKKERTKKKSKGVMRMRDLMAVMCCNAWRRYASLSTRLGEDDFFSDDLTDEELRDRLQHINVPVLFAPSRNDEAVPEHVDQLALLQRVSNATQSAQKNRVVMIEQADHAISEKSAQSQFLDEVENFVASLP